MSTESPSVVPSFDVTVHLVLDDFGKLGRSYLETEEEKADFESVVRGMLAGEYNRPFRVVAFNTAEKWSKDVSEDVAWEVLHRAPAGTRLPDSTHDFVEYYVGSQVVFRAGIGML